MLNINNIEVVYLNSILVLRGVTLEVPDGGIRALLGANGAGKTTTLKAISGLLKTEEGKVTDGTIEFDGSRVYNLAVEEQCDWESRRPWREGNHSSTLRWRKT